MSYVDDDALSTDESEDELDVPEEGEIGEELEAVNTDDDSDKEF